LTSASENPLSGARSKDHLTDEFLGAAQLDHHAALTAGVIRDLVTSVPFTI
jgi:hypothetical protein